MFYASLWSVVPASAAFCLVKGEELSGGSLELARVGQPADSQSQCQAEPGVESITGGDAWLSL